jgi:hypothetical protein
MYTQKLEQFKSEMEKAMEEALSNSKVVDMLENYGLEEGAKFKFVLDLNKIKSSNTVTDQELKASLESIPEDELVFISCCTCCKCPRPACCLGICCDC